MIIAPGRRCWVWLEEEEGDEEDDDDDDDDDVNEKSDVIKLVDLEPPLRNSRKHRHS